MTASESDAPVLDNAFAYVLIDEMAGDEYAKDHVRVYAARRGRIGSGGMEMEPVTVSEWIQRVAGDRSGELALGLTELIKECPFRGVRFETRGVNAEDARGTPFEFALVNDDRLADFAAYADAHAFADRLASRPEDPHGAAFPNEGGDATLVCPRNAGGWDDRNRYGHLASFLRGGAEDQVRGLWRIVAEAYRAELDARSPGRVWLSTAGGGVRWLHFRLDRRPKYYRHSPFRDTVPMASNDGD